MKKEMDKEHRDALFLSKLALAAYYSILIAVTAMIVFVLFIQLSWFTVVIGGSMEPTLHGYQLVFGDPEAEIQRGDIVTAFAPGDDNQRVIKRVIGMPGDRIYISSGGIIINGSRLYEGYLTQDAAQYTWPWDKKLSVTLGEDEYYLMGDNRLVSMDSRIYGPVKADRIVSVQRTTPDLAFFLKALVMVTWIVFVTRFSIPIEAKIRYKVQHFILSDFEGTDVPEATAQTDAPAETIVDES
jgi:signal peptidase I